jgi:hypothetical protein
MHARACNTRSPTHIVQVQDLQIYETVCQIKMHLYRWWLFNTPGRRGPPTGEGYIRRSTRVGEYQSL